MRRRYIYGENRAKNSVINGRLNLVDLAGSFHRFYNTCRCMVEDTALRDARLKLADTVRAVLANGLGLLGVSAPEKM